MWQPGQTQNVWKYFGNVYWDLISRHPHTVQTGEPIAEVEPLIVADQFGRSDVVIDPFLIGLGVE